MVSCYNAMYSRHHQNHLHHQFQAGQTASGYHQGQMQAGGFLTHQEDGGQMWHHHQPPHGMPWGGNSCERYIYHSQEFPDFVHSAIPPLVHHHQDLEQQQQLPSPTITVSGSEISSPGGDLSPPNAPSNVRPPPARSPYEWIKKTSYQSQPNPGKTRTKDKYRVVYTDHQRIELEKEFTFINKYITIRRKAELATTLGLSERQVKIWFQNRRAKERKQNKKRVEEKHQIEMYQPAAAAALMMEQAALPAQQQRYNAMMKSETTGATDLVA